MTSLFLTPWGLVAEKALFCVSCADSSVVGAQAQDVVASSLVTVTLRDQAVQDSYLDSDFPQTNFNTGGRLAVKYETKRPILRFSVDQYVPAGSEITNAILILSTTADRYPVEPVRSLTVDAYGLKRYWDISQVTWTHATSAVRWQIAGAGDVLFDRDQLPTDTRIVDRINATYSFDVTTLVRRWVNDPNTNYGMLLHGRAQSVEYRFYSTEEPNPSYRPRLVISYYPNAGATPTPTPTTPGVTVTPGTTPTPTRTATMPPVEMSATFPPVADAFVYEYEPDRNLGSDWYLRVKYDTKRSFIRFDVTSIPPSAQVTSATMWLRAYMRQGTEGPVELSAYRLRRPWVQAEVTWRHAYAGQLWAQGGANDIFFDRYDTPSGRVTMNSVGVWYQVDVAGAVQQWVTEPGTNYGFLLAGSMTSGEFLLFSSDYAVDSALRPRLEVRYFVPPATPTPTATATATETATATATPTVTETATTVPTATPHTGAIAGIVWEDVNGDGMLNAGEPPLPGALIKLYNRHQQEIGRSTTQADGAFRFAGLTASNMADPTDYYTIVETNPPGFVSTTDDTFLVRVSANMTTTINFGDQAIGPRTPTPTATPTATVYYQYALHLSLILKERLD